MTTFCKYPIVNCEHSNNTRSKKQKGIGQDEAEKREKKTNLLPIGSLLLYRFHFISLPSACVYTRLLYALYAHTYTHDVFPSFPLLASAHIGTK